MLWQHGQWDPLNALGPLNAFPWVLNGLIEALVSIRRKIYDDEGVDMREQMMDKIRQWFVAFREQNEKFPDYPDEEDGGSVFIFDPPPVIEEPEEEGGDDHQALPRSLPPQPAAAPAAGADHPPSLPPRPPPRPPPSAQLPAPRCFVNITLFS